MKRSAAFVALLASSLWLAGCGSAPELTPAEQPLPQETVDLLGKKGMSLKAPIFVRIFKEESELEVWKARDDGRYYHFKTYPICNWSGELGPKVVKGDKQAPEGFYSVKPAQMKPDSSFHVAFNLGFPNAYDKSLNRTGEYLMVHGKCKSAGCYAMTDALVEEIYALAREAFRGGQESFEVHAFPFRLTNEKLARFRTHKWHKFWSTLKDGYDYFETYRVPPRVAVCEHRYVVNVALPQSRQIDPSGRCPAFQRPLIEPFVPKAAEQQLASQRIAVPGPKSRDSTAVAAAAEQAVNDGGEAQPQAASAWTFVAGSATAPAETGSTSGDPAALGFKGP